MSAQPLVLGRKYKDKLSGFTGKATAVTFHIDRCVTVDLIGEMKEGETAASISHYGFDFSRLEDMNGNGVVIPGDAPEVETGSVAADAPPVQELQAVGSSSLAISTPRA